MMTGCAGNEEPRESTLVEPQERQDEYWLLPLFPAVMERSLELMSESDDFKSGESEIFDLAYINGVGVPVQLDIDNMYATRYPDERKIVFYPVKPMNLPDIDSTNVVGFLHYFDNITLNIFFQVLVTNSDSAPLRDSREDQVPPSIYLVHLVDNKGQTYGLTQSRILMKKDLEDEEAFRKFEASRRTVQIGTNLVDKNKFLYIFIKIPQWDDQIFQIYLRWY